MLTVILALASLSVGNAPAAPAPHTAPSATSLIGDWQAAVVVNGVEIPCVHAGFPSPGSGAFYKKATEDVSAEVEHLLNERSGTRH